MFNGKIHYKWPFSIAMLVYQRVRTLSKANLEAAPPDLFPLVAMIPISIRFSRSNGGWEEGAADFLVNTKLGMSGLTELLARLENLSHILAWSDRVAWTFHCTLLWRGDFSCLVFPGTGEKDGNSHLGINQFTGKVYTWIMFWHPCFGASLGHALEIFCSSPPTAGFLGMEPYSQCEACSWSLAISFLLLKPQFLVMGISPNVCTPSTIPKKQWE